MSASTARVILPILSRQLLIRVLGQWMSVLLMEAEVKSLIRICEAG